MALICLISYSLHMSKRPCIEGMSFDFVAVAIPQFNEWIKRSINPTVCFLKTSLCGIRSSHILVVLKEWLLIS